MGVGGGWGRAWPLSLQPLRTPPQPPTAHRFREALSDFRLALAQLRENATIDYTQLGLRFKLKAWEVSLHQTCTGSGPSRGGASWGPWGCCLWVDGPGAPSGPVLWGPLSCYCHRWGHVD